MKTNYKFNLNRKALPFFAVQFMLGLNPSAVFAQKPDFSGTWKINLDKSEFGHAPLFTVSKAMTIKQDAQLVQVDRTTIDTGGQDSLSTEKLMLTGEPMVITAADKHTRSLSLARSQDGTSLIESIHGTYAEGKTQFNATETWSLSPDGQNLTAERKVMIYKGFTYTVKAVYDKVH